MVNNWIFFGMNGVMMESSVHMKFGQTMVKQNGIHINLRDEKKRCVTGNRDNRKKISAKKLSRWFRRKNNKIYQTKYKNTPQQKIDKKCGGHVYACIRSFGYARVYTVQDFDIQLLYVFTNNRKKAFALVWTDAKNPKTMMTICEWVWVRVRYFADSNTYIYIYAV